MLMQYHTCARHSYYVTWLADHVIHDGHNTELIPRLLGAEEQKDQQLKGKPSISSVCFQLAWLNQHVESCGIRGFSLSLQQ